MQMRTDHIEDVDAQVLAVGKALEFNQEFVAANVRTVKSQIAAMAPDNVLIVAVEDLHIVEDFNVRVKNQKYYQRLEQLATSIDVNGFYPDRPISVYATMEGRKTRLNVTDGHRRLEAVRLLIERGRPITELPVVIKDKSISQVDLTVALIRSADGEKLEPLESAIACKRLRGFGLSVDDIALRVGFTTVYVKELLTLAGAPQSIYESVRSGLCCPATALSIMREHGGDAPAVLQAALETAKASGKQRVTAKFLPQQIRKKAFTKAAPLMFNAIERVKAHETYAQLPEDLREMIEDILAKVPAAAPDADTLQSGAEGEHKAAAAEAEATE